MSIIEKTNAFTLAETLLTMLIIGIIALVTIPSIIQCYQEQATVAKVKKIYSVLQQAFKLAEAENGLPENWGINQSNTMDNFLPYLNAQKCNDGEGCLPNNYVCLDGTPNTPLQNVDTTAAFAKFRLRDGTALFTNNYNKNCRYPIPDDKGCFWISVDLNGDKPPNAQGIDLFRFYVTNEGVFPIGYFGHYSHVYCSKSRGSYSYLSGINCANVIMQESNMDYLHL